MGPIFKIIIYCSGGEILHIVFTKSWKILSHVKGMLNWITTPWSEWPESNFSHSQ